ncbi:MAG: HEAT repeat domain-containing protein, partial [Promethearchaeota archaeon]
NLFIFNYQEKIAKDDQVSYLRENKTWDKEEELNWDVIEISKVDDKIIRALIESLKLDTPMISDNFFIAFESLMKIGQRAKDMLEIYITETNEIHNFKVDVFNFLLDFINDRKIEYLLVPQLYHPDFITRARTVFKIEQSGDKKYLNYLLPLLNDPDDSVRWAVIRFLTTFNLVKDPLVYKELKLFLEIESNPVIKDKVKEVFKQG